MRGIVDVDGRWTGWGDERYRYGKRDGYGRSGLRLRSDQDETS